jgi:hypothetical protein
MFGKSYAYIVVCKRPSFRLVDGVSQLMLFLSLVIFTSSFQSSGIQQHKTAAIAMWLVIAAITGWLIRSYFVQKKQGTAFYRIGMLAAAVGWALQENWQWVGIIFFLAAIIEKQVKFPVEIAFDEDEIVRNSFPKKYYDWNDLNNVVIKDGILTIDRKNNQLIQKEIENPGSDKAEREFNEFCSQRLAECAKLKQGSVAI